MEISLLGHQSSGRRRQRMDSDLEGWLEDSHGLHAAHCRPASSVPRNRLSPIGSRHFNRPTLNTHRGEELGGDAGGAEPSPGHWRPCIPSALVATAPTSVAWGRTHVVGLQQSVSGSPRAPSPTVQRAALHTCLGLPRTRLCPLRGGPSSQELRAGTRSEGGSGLLFLS